MGKHRWHDTANASYYVDEEGRVVGEVKRACFGSPVCSARLQEKSLGTYISGDHARQAVEKAAEPSNLPEVFRND